MYVAPNNALREKRAFPQENPPSQGENMFFPCGPWNLLTSKSSASTNRVSPNCSNSSRAKKARNRENFHSLFRIARNLIEFTGNTATTTHCDTPTPTCRIPPCKIKHSRLPKVASSGKSRYKGTSEPIYRSAESGFRCIRDLDAATRDAGLGEMRKRRKEREERERKRTVNAAALRIGIRRATGLER